MKDFLVIITSTIVFSAAILGAALVVALLVYELVAPSPTPAPTRGNQPTAPAMSSPSVGRPGRGTRVRKRTAATNPLMKPSAFEV